MITRTDKRPITVVADDRESRCRLVEILQEDGNFEVRIKRLSVGDYIIDDRFVFERKSMRDFVASVISKRLFSQSLRLVDQRFHPALVLESTDGDLVGSEMSREALQGALVHVSLMIGIPVLTARNPEETAALFRYAATQARTIALGALTRGGYRPKGRAALQSYILQGLPGIGPDRAKRLIERFDSVRSVFAAETDALQSVEGIGPKIAEKVDWAVRESLPSRYRF